MESGPCLRASDIPWEKEDHKETTRSLCWALEEKQAKRCIGNLTMNSAEGEAPWAGTRRLSTARREGEGYFGQREQHGRIEELPVWCVTMAEAMSRSGQVRRSLYVLRVKRTLRNDSTTLMATVNTMTTRVMKFSGTIRSRRNRKLKVLEKASTLSTTMNWWYFQYPKYNPIYLDPVLVLFRMPSFSYKFLSCVSVIMNFSDHITWFFSI